MDSVLSGDLPVDHEKDDDIIESKKYVDPILGKLSYFSRLNVANDKYERDYNITEPQVYPYYDKVRYGIILCSHWYEIL